MDADSGHWEFSQYLLHRGFGMPDTTDDSYLVKLWDKEEEASFFNVHLFKLNGTTYLDFYPELKKILQNDFYSSHILPLHTIAKIEFENDSIINIHWYNEDWMNRLINTNQTSLSHQKASNQGDTILIVTASTADLQKFLLEHGNDTSAFKANWLGQDKNKEAFSFHLKRQLIVMK